MERKALIELWDGAWQDGRWAVPWSKVREPEPDQAETERRSWEEPSQTDTEAWA